MGKHALKNRRGVGTYSAADILLRRREPLRWSALNKQLTSSEDSFEVACFLRIHTPTEKMKWRQGKIVMSQRFIEWYPFWRKRKIAITISHDYKITELSWRAMTFAEKILKFKPQFFVLHAKLEDGFVEFAIPELDIPLFVHRCMYHYGPRLEVQDDLEDTIKLVRKQAAAEKVIGERLRKAIGSFDVKGVTKSHKNPGAHDEYTLRSKDYRMEIIINPPRWIGIEFYWQQPDRKFRADYRIDTDLYDLSDPSNQWFADEIEDQIVEFLNILKDGKLLVGEKKGRPALIIPYYDEPLLLMRGRFWPFIQRSHVDLDKATSGGTFSQYRPNDKAH